MSIDRYRGEVDHMTAVASSAGFTGFEPETIMLEDEWNALSLRRTLDPKRLDLAALCLVNRWQSPVETPAEREKADRVINAVAQFSGSQINLVQYPGSDRSNLRERQDNAIACMREIALRAADRGVSCSFHPNSPVGSVFRTVDDYERMMDALEPSIGFTPDTGHIVAGGMDPLEVISRYRGRVRYIHVKDRYISGGWAPTGDGDVDIAAVVAFLMESGYDGWITFEDESPLAEANPDSAVLATGRFVRDTLMPLYSPTPEADR